MPCQSPAGVGKQWLGGCREDEASCSLSAPFRTAKLELSRLKKLSEVWPQAAKGSAELAVRNNASPARGWTGYDPLPMTDT